MFNAGIVKPGSTVYIPVNTFDSNDPSASVTATNWVNTDCHVHKDGGTTQRASSSGETLSIDFDTITGNHLLAIDLSDNTTANFYEAGSWYHVRIEGVTVDAGTINAWIGCFYIGYPGAILDTTIATLSSQTSFTLEDGSANNDAYNGCVAVIHDLASAVQIAIGYVSDYTGATKTVTLAADPGIFTMAAGDNISLFPPSNVMAWLGNAVTAGAGNRPAVDAEAVSGSAATADRVEAWMNAFLTGAVEEGGGPTTTVFQTDAAEATNDHFNNSIVVFTGGALLGQARRIADYVGATGTITVDPALTEAPTAGDTWIIFPLIIAGVDENGRVDVGRWLSTAVATPTTAGVPEVDITHIGGVAAAATKLEGSISTNLQGTASGTPTTTTMVSDITVTVDDQFNGRIIIFDNDTSTAALQGQATDITGCTAASNTLTFTAVTTAPSSGDTFQIV